MADAGDWQGREDSISLDVGGGGTPTSNGVLRPKTLRLLRGLLAPAEVEEVLRLSLAGACDSGEPLSNPVATPHHLLADGGSWRSGPLAEVVRPVVEERLLPYMREELRCADMALSQVLVRCYDASVRLSHKLHFDHNALGTAVFDLTPCPSSGLFVGVGTDAASQFFVPFASPGDAAVHSWDVAHGVRILRDHARVSLVVWAKPAEDVAAGTTSWYEGEAARGGAEGAEAAYRLGLEAEEAGELWTASTQLQAAAEAGHALAMQRLGVLLGERLGDPGGAVRWLFCAAAAGLAAAEVDLGDRLRGDGDFAGALGFYEKAAMQGDSRASLRLGAAYLGGLWGASEDLAKGHDHLQAALDAFGEGGLQAELVSVGIPADEADTYVRQVAAKAA